MIVLGLMDFLGPQPDYYLSEFNNGFTILAQFPQNIATFTKQLFPVSFTTIYGLSVQVHMPNGSYFFHGPGGWDNTGYWVSVVTSKGQNSTPASYVCLIAIGII